MHYKFYNENCITGAAKHIADNSIDLIISDPPYGIAGDKLDKHYNRNEKFVLDGYVEVPLEAYEKFSQDWILQAARVLKPGGAIYIVSGYTNLFFILNALRKTNLREMNHIIWKYNFGVYTKNKFVSSHYHILYYVKPGAKHTFNSFARFGAKEKNSEKNESGSANYIDRESVWTINREYNAGKVKNKNQLPTELLIKMIQYSSNAGDVVCDFFLGSFSTAKVAKGLNRVAKGFEINKNAYDYQIKEMKKIKSGYLLKTLRKPAENKIANQGKKFNAGEKNKVVKKFEKFISQGHTKKSAIEKTAEQFGRGYFSILNLLKNAKHDKQDKLL